MVPHNEPESNSDLDINQLIPSNELIKARALLLINSVFSAGIVVQINSKEVPQAIIDAIVKAIEKKPCLS